MAANYVLLEKITVAGATGASSVTFNSIPQTGYTDLVIKTSVRVPRSGQTWSGLFITLNGSTTFSSSRQLYGTGSGTSSGSVDRYDAGASTTTTATASTFSNNEIYIPNYTSSNNKSVSTDSVTENNGTAALATLAGSSYNLTSAITSIKIEDEVGNFAAGSTFYLYGVAKLGTTPAIQAYATGGDIIETDGTYWYHAFLSSGTFTPAKDLSTDVLVIAGGGGGGADMSAGTRAGGGGAGGVAYQTGRSALRLTGYTVTIGAGGAGAATTGNGSAGSNTVFSTITANGGGYGAGSPGGGNVNGGSGGSGGGASDAGAGGTATQGSSGGATGYGTAGSAQDPGGGGGGGAGQAGQSYNGGNGLNTWSSWASVTGTGVSGFYAGGGGGRMGSSPFTGGTGGSGGGGNYGGAAGVANTGSGGGGGGGDGGRAGGSGIVIVRYAV